MVRKAVITQLQSVGEGALEKIAQSPATRNAYRGAVQVKERGERLFHALEAIDERLSAIERRLGTLEKANAKRTRPAARAPRTARASSDRGKASA